METFVFIRFDGREWTLRIEEWKGENLENLFESYRETFEEAIKLRNQLLN